MTIEKGLFADNENQRSLSRKEPNNSDDESLSFPENDNYLAFNILRGQKRQTRLDIRRRDGTGTIIYYGYIATIEYSGDELITIIYQNSAFIITGKNLKKLREYLQDERVRYIQEAPLNIQLESDQCVIESITQTKIGDGN